MQGFSSWERYKWLFECTAVAESVGDGCFYLLYGPEENESDDDGVSVGSSSDGCSLLNGDISFVFYRRFGWLLWPRLPVWRYQWGRGCEGDGVREGRAERERERDRRKRECGNRVESGEDGRRSLPDLDAVWGFFCVVRIPATGRQTSVLKLNFLFVMTDL